MITAIRLIIADDYPMFREGLKLILNNYDGLAVCGEASNGKELLKLLESTVADIVIADIQMPEMDGVAATAIIREKFPAVKVIALSMYGNYHLIVDMLEAGACGYLLKDVAKDDVVDAIHAVQAGNFYYCKSTNLQLTKMIAGSKAHRQPLKPVDLFNKKELDIIRLICEEYASKQIAASTNLTLKSVEKYRNRIMEKMGCKNVAGVVVYAVRTGIYKV